MFMIINESERNRIKSLYGLITEDVPPSESVLVANKNPFKYSEYENARKLYSGDLKDGDLFYVLTLSDDYDRYKLEKEIMDSFLSTIENKSLRYNKSDFAGKKNLPYMSTNDKFSNMVCVIKSHDESKIINIPNYRINMECKTDDGNIVNFDQVLLSTNEEGVYFDIIKGFGTSYISFKGVNDFYNTNIKNKIAEIKNKTNVENLPDNLFEIRKVQRQKTDF